jgi:lysozyme
MSKTNPKATKRKKIHKTRRKNYLFRRYILLAILGLTLLGTGLYLRDKVAFYYAMYFEKFVHKNLKNSTKKKPLESIKLSLNIMTKFSVSIFLIISTNET